MKRRTYRLRTRQSIVAMSRNDFFKHRGTSQRFQTVKSAPAQASTTTETTTVNFQVSVATNVGERVVAVGSCTPLGIWEPRKGIELHITNATFPLWQAQILKSQYVVTFYCQCLCGREPLMSREM